MKRIRLALIFAWVLVAVACAYWGGVVAQEGRPLFAPPPVLPKEEVASPGPSPTGKEKPAPNKVKTPSADEAGKNAPTLIIPRDVFEVPPPVAKDVKGQALPIPPPDGAILPPDLMPPPVVQPKGPIPPDAPPALSGGIPGLVEEQPPATPNALPDKAVPIDKSAPVKKEIETPKAKTPMAAPAIEFPAQEVLPIKQENVIPEPTRDPVPTKTNKQRAFVPIRSGNGAAPVQQPLAGPPPSDLPTLISPTPPVPAPIAGPLVASANAPNVSVEKHGAERLPAGLSQVYSILIKNLGPVLAGKVVVEDELPAQARIISADPVPVVQGNRAIWTFSSIAARDTLTVRLVIQAPVETTLANRIRVRVSSETPVEKPGTIAANVSRPETASLKVQLVPPASIGVGKAGIFKVRIINQTEERLEDFVLHGSLPLGLSMPISDEKGTREERQIVGKVEMTLAPGETRTLDMPATATRPGRHTVEVKVTARGGHQASASAVVAVIGETLQVQQPTTTRMFLGRDGDLRIEVKNHTDKALRNISVADRLPEGLDFVAASDRGLYQANSRTVYWLLNMSPGETKALVVRLRGTQPGDHQNVVQVKADGFSDQQSLGVIQLDGVADLSLRVVERDPLIEVGAETVYEIQVNNAGTAPATNVKLQLRFPPGLTPKKAQGGSRHAIERDGVTFDPIASLAGQTNATFRVWAVAQPNSDRDQRVSVSVVSDQVSQPIQREVRTLVVPR